MSSQPPPPPPPSILLTSPGYPFDLEPIHCPIAFVHARHPDGQNAFLDQFRSPSALVAVLWPSAARDPVHAHKRILTEIAMWAREMGDGEPEAPGDDGPGDGEP